MSDQQHANGNLIRSHIGQLADHEGRIKRNETRIGEHDVKIDKTTEKVIELKADIKASRWIIVTTVSLVGVVLAVLQLVM